jgi:predicted nucleic acid-binding protein
VAQRLSSRSTTFVLLECGNAAARRPYRNEVNTLRRTLEQRRELVAPTDQDWRDAWDAYERGEAGQAGIVDHVSFVVMRRLGISQAFTNDRHFQAAGFSTLF